MFKSFFAIASLLALAVANPLETRATPQSDIDAYLKGHNTVRAQHGAAALTWDENLASKAQQWANGCVFKHSGGSLGPYGGTLRTDQLRQRIFHAYPRVYHRESCCRNWRLHHCSCHQVVDG